MLFSKGSGFRSTISMPSTKGWISWLPTGPVILAPAVAYRSRQKQFSSLAGKTVGSLRGSRISKSTLIPAGRLLRAGDLALRAVGLARVARVGFVGALPGGGNGKSLSGGHPMPAHTWK